MRSPWTRMRGGSPAITCRSEPLRMYMLFRKSLINDMACSFSARVRAGALAGGLGRSRCAHAAREHRGVGDEALELLAIIRIAIGVIGIDELARDGAQESHIHELHALLLARLQLRWDL